MPSVPLISASPSLACSSTGARPASLSATDAGRRSPCRSVTSPSPISASAQCDSGARSPEQPREPNSWTTGVIPWLSIPAIVCAVSRRMPVRPVASVDRRSSIRALVTSRSTSGPLPAACDRISDRCSWARIWGGMCRVASAPNPVEMPYAGVRAAASTSTAARALSTAATASAASTTGAPSRATASTSAKDRGPVPTVTGCSEVMAPLHLVPGPSATTGTEQLSRIRDSLTRAPREPEPGTPASGGPSATAGPRPAAQASWLP
jgi:hypothetical protein